MDIIPIKFQIHYADSYWYVEFQLLGFSKTLKHQERSLLYMATGSDGKPELQLLWMKVF